VHRSRGRQILASVAALAIVSVLGFLWADSLLPGAYGVVTEGHADHGGVPQTVGGVAGGRGVPVTDVVADPARPSDVVVDLVARRERATLPSGREVDGYTLNGATPGPLIRARQGQLVEVRLLNENVEDGVTLHWHGVDVPGAMDGVAGVTQDAVAPGERFVYRFVADQVGTYWYHSHQMSHEQVRRGLLGMLVVDPPVGDDAAPEHTEVLDVPALVHIYDGHRTVNGVDGSLRVEAPPGNPVRVRVANTDNGPMPVWVSGAPSHVLAVDGTDVNAPPATSDTWVLVTAGGRVDLGVDMPADGSPVRVELGGSAAVILGLGAALDDPPDRTPRPPTRLDLLTYGTPAPTGLDVAAPDRTFAYVIGRRPGFVKGRPGMWWTVNGRLYPDVPTFVVSEGDVVRMRIENRSGDVHPMHLHGHHAVVLSHNDVPATGSPWWVDSLDVADGDTYEIAFVADNPGIWADHCHNLPHAAEGLVAHLVYAGYTTPFHVGGSAGNAPE